MSQVEIIRKVEMVDRAGMEEAKNAEAEKVSFNSSELTPEMRNSFEVILVSFYSLPLPV